MPLDRISCDMVTDAMLPCSRPTPLLLCGLPSGRTPQGLGSIQAGMHAQYLAELRKFHSLARQNLSPIARPWYIWQLTPDAPQDPMHLYRIRRRVSKHTITPEV
jgi:hypothetical protein